MVSIPFINMKHFEGREMIESFCITGMKRWLLGKMGSITVWNENDKFAIVEEQMDFSTTYGFIGKKIWSDILRKYIDNLKERGIEKISAERISKELDGLFQYKVEQYCRENSSLRKEKITKIHRKRFSAFWISGYVEKQNLILITNCDEMEIFIMKDGSIMSELESRKIEEVEKQDGVEKRIIDLKGVTGILITTAEFVVKFKNYNMMREWIEHFFQSEIEKQQIMAYNLEKLREDNDLGIVWINSR